MANISSLEKLGTFPKGVLVYGHFSSFHHGHIRFLKAAKDEGEELIVALIGDEAKSLSQGLQFNQSERANTFS